MVERRKTKVEIEMLPAVVPFSDISSDRDVGDTAKKSRNVLPDVVYFSDLAIWMLAIGMMAQV